MAFQPFNFLLTSTPRERRALAASALGWMLDGLDVTLYSMVIAELLPALHLSKTQAGLLASTTLFGSALGGIVFGLLADRFGRRFALMASIVMYSVSTAACGFSRGFLDLGAFRFLVGIGMGGQWGTGAALVAETWRAEHRTKAMGLMTSGFGAGYALAAGVAALVLPRWGWRAVFFAGILPALFTLWIRRGVEESPLWLARAGRGRRDAETPAAKPSSQGRSAYSRFIAIALLMNSAALFAWWGLFTWIPPFLSLPFSQGGRGLAITTSTIWIIVMQGGMWLGCVTFGFIGDALGRKRAYVGFLMLAGALVPFYARAHAAWALLTLGPLLGFFGTGHFAGFGVITAELFPTDVRAFAMGLTYNFGRALSAAAPWAIGALAGSRNLNSAFWLSGVSFFLAGAIALAVPENRARTVA